MTSYETILKSHNQFIKSQCSATLTANDNEYINMLVELKVEEDGNDKDNGPTWDSPSQRVRNVIIRNGNKPLIKAGNPKGSDYLQLDFKKMEMEDQNLLYLYWTPKFHKSP